jgi:hypothetical protein
MIGGMDFSLRRFLTPCLVTALSTLSLAGCGKDKPPAKVNSGAGLRPYREMETDNERRLKESNAQIIEQLLTAYQRGSDPAAGVEDQRQAELALRAAMIRLEYWYSHGGRDYLLGPADAE